VKCRTPHSKLDPILWDFTHTQNASKGSLNSNANVLLLLLVVVVVTRRQDYDLDKLREPNNSCKQNRLSIPRIVLNKGLVLGLSEKITSSL
jgi:hypothetical protein